MPITSADTDPVALTLTVVADFTAPVRRLWDAYLDPRQLERFWGPPGYPATFTRHDGFAGGLSNYYMTSPEGEKFGGYWKWTAVDEGRGFEVLDGFANDDGTPNTEMPEGRMVFEFTETALGSRVTCINHHDSLEDMEKVLAMGQVEGMKAAMGQMDDVLADLASFAAGNAVEVQLIGENQARTSRIVRGTVEQVWRAHHDPELLRRWMLGPDGWTMPVCEVATEVGQRYRNGWRSEADGSEFGFTGEVLEISAPHRSVTTEAMWTPDDPEAANSPSTLNELTLTPVEGGTLVAALITYPDAATREMILATGMSDGMETSYARLESEVLAA